MEYEEIALARIHVSDRNVRKDLEAGVEDAGIDDLATSIRDKGLLSPVILRRRDDGSYDLIAGQRRLLACQRLGWSSIPAVIRQVNDTDATVISLVENVHRADLNPIDKARAYQAILDKVGDPGKVAQETGVSVGTVRKYLSLLRLAPSIQERLRQVEGPAGIAALSRIAQDYSPEQQERVLDQIGGFKQDIQLEMLRRSAGNLGALQELREQALEGAFDTKLCRGLTDCSFIPPELRAAVVDAVERFKKDGATEPFIDVVRRLRR